jgi:hypothetical protein
MPPVYVDSSIVASTASSSGSSPAFCHASAGESAALASRNCVTSIAYVHSAVLAR